MESKIINDDFYIILKDDYKENDILPVIKMKSGVEFELLNDEIISIIIPDLIKQFPPQLTKGMSSDEISVEVADIEFKDGMLFISLDVEGTIITVQFDCNELRNRNI